MNGDWIEDVSQTNNFTYNEQIHSAYSLLTTKYRNLSISAGLRFEQTYINGKQEINSEKIRQNYFNLYPSTGLLHE